MSLFFSYTLNLFYIRYNNLEYIATTATTTDDYNKDDYAKYSTKTAKTKSSIELTFYVRHGYISFLFNCH